MQNNLKYINLSWAVVGICQSSHKPLSFHIPDIDKDEAAAVEHYVIGYLAFWHIAFGMSRDLWLVMTKHCTKQHAKR